MTEQGQKGKSRAKQEEKCSTEHTAGKRKIGSVGPKTPCDPDQPGVHIDVPVGPTQ